jgi:hypothetical protein
VFDENDFPFSQLHPNAGSQLRSKILLLPPMLHNSHEHELVNGQGANDANPGLEHVVQAEEILGEEAEEEARGCDTSTSENGTDLLATLDPEGASTSDLVFSIGKGSPLNSEPDMESGLVSVRSSSAHEPGRWPGQMPMCDSSGDMR